jgi:hypothetical protein
MLHTFCWLLIIYDNLPLLAVKPASFYWFALSIVKLNTFSGDTQLIPSVDKLGTILQVLMTN